MPAKPFEGLRLAPFKPLGMVPLDDYPSAEVAEAELRDLFSEIQGHRTRFANLRMIGSTGPIVACVTEWVNPCRLVAPKLRLAQHFELNLARELETLYRDCQAEIDVLVNELQSPSGASMQELLKHVATLLDLFVFNLEQITRDAMTIDFNRYERFKNALAWAQDVHDVFERLSQSGDVLVTVAARPVIESILSRLNVFQSENDQLIDMSLNQMCLDLGELLELVREYKQADRGHIQALLQDLKKDAKSDPNREQIQKLIAVVQLNIQKPKLTLSDADFLSQEIRVLSDLIFPNRMSKRTKQLHRTLECLRLTLLSQPFSESPPDVELHEKLGDVSADLKRVVQALRTGADSGISRVLFAEWNDFLLTIIDDFELLLGVSCVLSPGSHRYTEIASFLREIGTVLVRLDDKVLSDYELLSHLAQVFQPTIDYVTEQTEGAGRRIEDCSEWLFERICLPLGEIEEVPEVKWSVVVEIPPKGLSKKRLHVKVRRILKALEGIEVVSLSQALELDLKLATIMLAIIAQDDANSLLKALEEFERTDDRPAFNFQRRIFARLAKIYELLVDLISANCLAAAGQTPNTERTLSILAEVLPGVKLSFESLEAQQPVFEAIQTILQAVSINFTFSQDEKSQFACECPVNVSEVDRRVNALSLGRSIQFLSRYLTVFPIDTSGFGAVVRAITLFCDYFNSIPNHSQEIETIIARVKAAILRLIVSEDDFPGRIRPLQKILEQTEGVVGILSGADRCPRISERYTSFMNSLTQIVPAVAENPRVSGAATIVATLRVCSLLRMRLYVGLSELQTFVLAAHNLTYVTTDKEVGPALQLLLSAISPSFPNSSEMRKDVHDLIAASQQRFKRP
jgi:hypothetical protein